VLAFWVPAGETCRVQGKSETRAELLDAGALCRHLVPDGSMHAFLADHRSELFPDELFEDLFPSRRGRPSVPGDVMATALILQKLEGLSDRDAARAVRTDLAWKVACGLPVTDEGFHYSVLTYWRQRLAASTEPHRVADAVRRVIDETGVLQGKRRRALDSTLLDDAVATQDTVTQLISAIRRVRRLIPEAAVVVVSGHDYAAAGKPVCAWDDPVAKQALITGLVNDALAIIDALEGVDLTAEQADAVGLLALVAGQDVEPGDTDGTWRIAQRVAPDRVISTVDPESRHMHKSVSSYRDGFKAHVAVEPETGLITACDLTPANAPDGPTGVALLDGEAPGLQVLADSAYGSAQTRSNLDAAGHDQAIKPMPLRRNKRLGDDQFTRDDFIVDHDAGTVTCPGQHTLTIQPAGAINFGIRCRTCPLRSRCTSSAKGRSVNVVPGDQHLVAARAAWTNGDFADDYRQHRPMVERSISWLVAKGNRRVRYRGITKNTAGLQLRVAAINLRRLLNLGLHHNGTGWALA
jgi:IS5 family transposase